MAMLYDQEGVWEGRGVAQGEFAKIVTKTVEFDDMIPDMECSFL
jgi:hypothetical protein